MATDVSVVIAHRDMGCGHRARSFEHVLGWYTDAGLRVTWESGDNDDTFSRARAINEGIRRVGSGIIVQSDPDSLVPLHVLRQAIETAAARPGLVIPHDRFLYTDHAGSLMVMAGDLRLTEVESRDCEFTGNDGSGNVVVFSRETWETVGGFDERFGLWGGDDAAFRYACEAYHGPARRLAGPMVHLWHPRLPQSEPGHPLYVEQFALLAQYRDAAAAGPEAVRALVEARRAQP